MDTLEIDLYNLGLTKEEVTILIVIAKGNDLKVTDIATKTGIPRPSVYRYIETLTNKGLLKKVLTTQGNSIELADLAILKSQIQEKQEILSKQVGTVDSLIENIKTLAKSGSNTPELRYYEGKEGIKQLIWNTLQAKETLRCYTNAMRQDIVGKTWLTDYCLTFCNKNLTEKTLGDSIYAKESYQSYGGRKEYYSPIADFTAKSDERVLNLPFLVIKGEMYIYNDVFSFYTWESDKLVGAEIQSIFIASTQASIFDVLWNLTKPKDTIDKFTINTNTVAE